MNATTAPAAAWTWLGYDRHEAAGTAGTMEVYAVAAGLYRAHLRRPLQHDLVDLTNYPTTAEAKQAAERLNLAAQPPNS